MSGVQSVSNMRYPWKGSDGVKNTLIAFSHYNFNSYIKLKESESLVLKNSNIELEGWNEKDAFEWTIRDLERFSIEYQKFLTDEECLRINQAIQQLKNVKKLLKKSVVGKTQKVYQSVSQLETKGSVLIPVGFKEHFLLCEVECSKNTVNKKRFAFKVFDSGYGALKHHHVVAKKVYRFIAKNLSLEELDEKFLEKIFLFDESKEVNPEDLFYSLIKRQFQDKLVVDLQQRPHRIQKLGICTTKPINFWLSDFLNNKRLYFLIKSYRTNFLLKKFERLKIKDKFLGKLNPAIINNKKDISLEEVKTIGYLSLEKRAFKALKTFNYRDPFCKAMRKAREVALGKIDPYVACKVAIDSGKKDVCRVLKGKIGSIDKKRQGVLIKRAIKCNQEWMVNLLLSEGDISQEDKEKALLEIAYRFHRSSRTFRRILETTSVSSSVSNLVFKKVLNKRDYSAAIIIYEHAEMNQDNIENALQVCASNARGSKLLKSVLSNGGFTEQELKKALKTASDKNNKMAKKMIGIHLRTVA